MPVTVAAWSKALVYGRSPAAIVGSNASGGMDVCLLCVVRGLCDELITRPEEVLPTVARRCVWLRNLVDEEAIARTGLQSQEKKSYIRAWEKRNKVTDYGIYLPLLPSFL
jgi:hypothetical protein